MKAKKLMALLLCAVLLVTGTIMGTMAYLTSQDEVVNTFTVGKVAITLDELDVDESTANAARDKANEYHLLPGSSYVKDPTVHVAANSEDSYIFVKVENGLAKFEAAQSADYDTIAKQIEKNGWTELSGVANVFYKTYTKNVAVTDLFVFDKFVIAGNANEIEGWAAIQASETAGGATAGAKITVTAYAIQSEGFADANAAWTASGFGA